MLELSKGFTDQDIIGFDFRVRKLVDTDAPQYTVEPRMAGVTVELFYEEGNLTKALREGEDGGGAVVTAHIMTILTVPLTLIQVEERRPVPGFLAAWGIAYLEKQAFAELNRQRAARGLSPFVHPRAAVEDSLRQTNPRVTAKIPLNLFCHGAELRGYAQIPDHFDLLLTLQQWGLRVNRPHIRLCSGVTEVIGYCRHLEEHHDDFPYHLDGAVITLNALSFRAKMGEGLGRAETAMVYLIRPA
jgi:DNA ligase (NAD+)